MKRGNFTPQFVLCVVSQTTGARAPWRVIQSNVRMEEYPKLLVTSLTGRINDIMIEFMSHYRTRDKAYNRRTRRFRSSKKYYPKGALFWVPCDIDGVQRGPALFVKRVPDPGGKQDRGMALLKERFSQVPPLKEILCSDPHYYTLNTVKPKLRQ